MDILIRYARNYMHKPECILAWQYYIVRPMLNVFICEKKKDLGPVVQSIVSLTSSLRGQLLSVLQLYDQIH